MFDDDILRFDVSVNDAVAVNVGDSFIDVAEDKQSFRFGELLPIFDEFIEVVT